MNPKQEAKQILTYYMRTALNGAGILWNYDMQSEIETIVDLIVKAAREPELKKADFITMKTED